MSSATDTISDRSSGRGSALLDFLKSSIGAKVLMAFSGAGLWTYLLLHVAGNLPVLWDRTAFNGYAEILQTNPPLLWTERILVFGGMAVHALMGFRLTRLNRAARGAAGYQHRATATSTVASRTMIVSGALILAFFVYHILHFTAHAVGGATFATETLANGHTRPDAGLMVSSAFTNPVIVAVYVVGQILVFTHLYHGSVSLFQSLGMFRIFQNPVIRVGAKALALAITAGAMSIPLILFFSQR